MKPIEEYTRKELYDMAKLLRIKNRSKMNKNELYIGLKIYYRSKWIFDEEYKVYLDPCHIAAYFPKDSSNKLKETFENDVFFQIDYDQIADRNINMGFVKELSFLLEDGKISLAYMVSNNPANDFLVIESETYFGFVAPLRDLDEDEEDDY